VLRRPFSSGDHPLMAKRTDGGALEPTFFVRGRMFVMIDNHHHAGA
jgi:hypothetical protein